MKDLSRRDFDPDYYTSEDSLGSDFENKSDTPYHYESTSKVVRMLR